MKIKNILLAVFIILILTAALSSKTYAFWPFDLWNKKSQTGRKNKFSPLIQRIINRFNLNAEEVEKVIEEERNEQEKERQKRLETRLEQAVKEGVITQEQKEALLKKQSEWRERERQLWEEKKQWLEQSGIDFEKLKPYGCGLGRGKMRRGGHFGGI